MFFARKGIVAFETKEIFSAALIKETSVLSGNCLKTCLAQFFAGRSALLMLNLYASALASQLGNWLASPLASLLAELAS